VFNKKLIDITEKIINNRKFSPSYDDMVSLTGEDVYEILICANKIRERYKGQGAFTCSIVNAKSGSCSQDCAFCAQSAYNKTGAVTYPLMNEADIVSRAIDMYNAGADRFSMVTSGYMLKDREIDTICRATEKIRQKTPLKVCTSLGMLTESLARRLKESGVDTYHHNLETARSYFAKICTTHDYDEDIATVRIAGSAGLRTCSGGILGLGETWEQRMELAFTLKEMDVDSIPVNLLNPIPGTRMETRSLLPPMEAIKSIALFRMINPDKDITICGGREVVLKDFQSWIFLAGANGIMIGDYLTTKGRNAGMDMEMIRQMGLKPA